MLTQQSMICRKYHGKTGYLLGNIDMVIQKFAGMGYHMNNMQMMQTDKSQMMTSRGSRTSQLHKPVAPTIRTNKLHKMIAQNKMTSCPRMEMTNNAFRYSRATQVHVEDLRLLI